MNFDLLKILSETPGVPGREERVREVLRDELRPMVDSITTDAMGNLIATRKCGLKSPKRVLLACHMDEIGFYVKHVTTEGFLKLNSVGGFDTRNLFARRVLVQANEGGDIVGLLTPGGRPVHIAKEEDRKKIPEVGEFYVDLCLPADDVKRRVRVGDPVTLVQPLLQLGDCVTGKALDNRVAGFVAIEALRKSKKLACDVIFVATVQEEVGCRGAGPAAFAAKPDIAIGIDTTLCCDTPGVPEDERVTKQGDGVALTVMDGTVISDRGLIDSFAAVAAAKSIPFQLSILPRGGTDTAPMQRSAGGVRAMTLSVPTRYIHTVTETIHGRDLQAAIDLLAAWLQKRPE
ncbi:MAG TPA: M20/M25/M40 family metallo-hydrolase [Tepidisphaeraceae bacterium]|jgi:endoglucanase